MVLMELPISLQCLDIEELAIIDKHIINIILICT